MSPVLLVSVESPPASGILNGQRPGCHGASGVCPLVQAIHEMTSSGFRILIWVKGVGWATSSLRFFPALVFCVWLLSAQEPGMERIVVLPFIVETH